MGCETPLGGVETWNCELVVETDCKAQDANVL